MRKICVVLAFLAIFFTFAACTNLVDGGGGGGNSSSSGGGDLKTIIITGMPNTPYDKYKSTGVSIRVVPVGTASNYYTINNNCEATSNINSLISTGNSTIADGKVIFKLFNNSEPWTGSGNHCLYLWDYYANTAGVNFPAYVAASVDLSQMNITVPFSMFTAVTVIRGSP